MKSAKAIFDKCSASASKRSGVAGMAIPPLSNSECKAVSNALRAVHFSTSSVQSHRDSEY